MLHIDSVACGPDPDPDPTSLTDVPIVHREPLLAQMNAQR
jgi:hypothetical protein